MDYGSLLSRAWTIVWNHKFLFVLGFLAALGGGSSGNAGSNINYSSSRPSDFNLPSGFAEEMESFFSRMAPFLLGIGCFLVVLALVFWLLRLAAQAGLIHAVSQIEAGQDVLFSEAFAAGSARLGRMIGLNLVLFGPFALVAVVGGGIIAVMAGTAVMQSPESTAASAPMALLLLCSCLLACLLIPVWLVVSLIYPFAQRGLVLSDLGVTDSVRHGWQVLRTHTTEVLLLVVIFAVIGFLFGIVTVVVALPAVLLMVAPMLVNLVQGAESIGATEIAFLVGGGICVGLLSAAVQSILTAYRSTTITLAYQQFQNKEALAMPK